MILPILKYSIRLLHDYYRLGNGSSGALVRSQTLVMHGRLGKKPINMSWFTHTHFTLRRRFEDAHGTDDALKDVDKQCYNAEPRHGERWTMISKDIANWR